MDCDRDGSRVVGLGAGPPWIAGRCEHGEPIAEEVEGGDRAAGRVNPVVRQPTVEVPGESFAGAGAGTSWLTGAPYVVQPDGAALVS